MPTKIEHSGNKYQVTVLFETDIKDYDNEKPNTLVVPGKDIEVPLGASLIVKT